MDWVKGQAIWKQIEMILLNEIVAGTYKPGQKLPTENELAKRFGVNRHTVRNAISALCDANVTVVEQGKGIFVKERVLPYPLKERTRFSQIVSGRHRLPDKHFIGYTVVPAPTDLAAHLDLKPGTDLTRIESVSIADKFPIAHSISYLESQRFPGITKIFASEKSLTKTLMHFGIHDYTRKWTKIISTLPDKDIAEHLQQPRSKPILQTESLDITADGKPLEYGITCFSSSRVELIVE